MEEEEGKNAYREEIFWYFVHLNFRFLFGWLRIHVCFFLLKGFTTNQILCSYITSNDIKCLNINHILYFITQIKLAGHLRGADPSWRRSCLSSLWVNTSGKTESAILSSDEVERVEHQSYVWPNFPQMKVLKAIPWKKSIHFIWWIYQNARQSKETKKTKLPPFINNRDAAALRSRVGEQSSRAGAVETVLID